jgi:glycosyltransferase involved in cell wall biosynthesis
MIRPVDRSDRSDARPRRVLEAFEPRAGGVPAHVLQLSVGLARRGHDLTVTGPPNARVREALAAAGLNYLPLPWRGSVPSPRADAAVARALSSQLGRGGFDLVHAHGQKAGLLARLAAIRARTPSLYSPHCFVYRTQLARPRAGRRARFRAGRAVERALGSRTALLLACSRDEARIAVGDRLVPPERVRFVEHGVAPRTDAPANPELLDFRGEGPLLGIVSGLRDQKGLPTLLDALELLAAEGRAPRFAIVGDGPLRDEVRDRTASGPLAHSTLLRPFDGWPEPHLAALDAFVLPSLWEGMPIALLEAMAMGLPVIASAVGGTPEAVAHGRTGLLVPSGDPRALADAIAELARDAAARERMGHAAREEARARFSVERMVGEIEEAYRSVAGPQGSP